MDNLLPLCGFTAHDTTDRHLVLCPYAGSSASAFRHWREIVSPGMRVSLAIYPGRDHRLREACVTQINALADSVVYDLESSRIHPEQLIIAGHSMGAQVAFEVCTRLERQGRTLQGLVLSGCHAAHLRERHPISHLEDREFLEHLVAIGGCAQAWVHETALWPVFMPMLRADFQATEGYGYTQEPSPAARLKTPALLVYGSADDEAGCSEVEAWKTWLDDVQGPVSLAGDHFYITRRPRAILEHIRRRFDSGYACAGAFKKGMWS